MKIIRSPEFIKNIKSIKDAKLNTIITRRLARFYDGNFGDTKSLGGNIYEIRIHYGSGYRIYYTRRGEEIIILLCAGEKSHQKKSLETAKKILKEVYNEKK